MLFFVDSPITFQGSFFHQKFYDQPILPTIAHPVISSPSLPLPSLCNNKHTNTLIRHPHQQQSKSFHGPARDLQFGYEAGHGEGIGEDKYVVEKSVDDNNEIGIVKSNINYDEDSDFVDEKPAFDMSPTLGTTM